MKLLSWRGRISKTAFRDRVCALLREKLPAAVIEVTGDLDVRVNGLESREHVDLWLGRGYEELCRKPAEADEIISRNVRSILSCCSDPPLALDRVIPAIKPRDWASRQRSTLGSDVKDGFNPWIEPYNAELCIVYAEYREALRFPHRSAFDALGLDSATLLERALANLRRMIEVRIVGDQGAYLIGAGGTVDAAVILLDDVMTDQRLQLAGRPLAGVSDRDSVWVADDANPWAVFRVAAAVLDHHRSDPYPISPSLYQRSEGRWESLDPNPVDDTHPIPNLQTIDIHVKKNAGADLAVVVASPLGVDARSIFRLCRKLDGYLQEVNSSGYQEECGRTTVQNTSIIVYLHPRSDPEVEQILMAAAGWAQQRNVTLRVEKTTPDAVA